MRIVKKNNGQEKRNNLSSPTHRDDSIASLTKSFLLLMPPLGHLKYDVLKHFLYHLLYYTACKQTSLT